MALRLPPIHRLTAFTLGVMAPFLLANDVQSGAPEWMKEGTLTRQGHTLIVSCLGSGPSLDLARKEALQSCRNSAMAQLQSTISVKSQSIETEQESVFHQEVKHEAKYSGLNCLPLKEAIDTNSDQTTVYLRCKFDLSRIAVVDTPKEEAPAIASEEAESSSLVKAQSSSNDKSNESEKVERKGIVRSNSRQVLIATIPACDSILVNSKFPRVIRCKENPQTVLIEVGTDTELVIRAKGYLPKSLPLQQRAPASGETEVIHVQMERP